MVTRIDAEGFPGQLGDVLHEIAALGAARATKQGCIDTGVCSFPIGDFQIELHGRVCVMSGGADPDRTWLSGSLWRAAGFLAFWVALSGYAPADLLVGALSAAAATCVSLRLLPPGQRTFRPRALAAFLLRFGRQSAGAGIDVARLALDPRLPLYPGFVIYRPRLPPGPIRDGFSTVTSLLPGTLPCGTDESDGVVIHCLDVNQPVLEQLAAEEAMFVRALGGSS